MFIAVPYIQHSFQPVEIGSNAFFSCVSEMPLSWGFHGKILPSNVEVYGASHENLKISDVQMRNEGVYNCTTSDSGGRVYELETKLRVVGKIKDYCFKLFLYCNLIYPKLYCEEC